MAEWVEACAAPRAEAAAPGGASIPTRTRHWWFPCKIRSPRYLLDKFRERVEEATVY